MVFQLWGSFTTSKNQPHKIYHLKKINTLFILKKNFKIFQKISQSKNFWKSMSHDFSKFMVHDFLKINVPRFFEIHGPWFFEIQCPKDFCDFGLLSRLAQAEGLIDYYMIFHYQKVSLLNYYSDPRVRGQY
jgi:hypothetical protein